MNRLPVWPSTRGRATRRRGAVLVYTTAAIVVFCGFCVLAVDWGRVQLAKSELMRATDAAARAAAAQLPGDPAAARAAAVLYASYNTVDGQPLSLQPQDVVLGRWNPGTGTLDPTAP